VAANHEYKDDEGGIIFSNKTSFPMKRKLFKSNCVRVDSSKRKISSSHNDDTHKQSKVVPVLNDDEIVGVMIECSCGEVVKILFKYE